MFEDLFGNDNKDQVEHVNQGIQVGPADVPESWDTGQGEGFWRTVSPENVWKT